MIATTLPQATQRLAEHDLLQHLENQVNAIAPDYSLLYITHPAAYKAAETFRFYAKLQSVADPDESTLADVVVHSATKDAIAEAVRLKLGTEWFVMDFWVPEDDCPF